MAAPKDTISERNYTGLGVQDIHLYGTLGSKEHVNLGAPQDSISEGNYTGLDVQDIDLYDAVGSNARINVGDQHTERVCTPCPQGWLQFQAKCYYFSTELNNWEDSRIDCIKQGLTW
ncbi:hypothetical protein JZ751_005324 [Albula glossodonta]|uniref:C-type lectin domain-containing protein n=1 Tax=Albula glossodonta TaxID=121402 RepID=A0A8T2MUT0_9TELE|nr:hypothetical protein JZ751_005324 [Albula glossodonta]